jgi:FimV-like protein
MMFKAIRAILLFSLVPIIAFAQSVAPNSSDNNGTDINSSFIDAYEDTHQPSPDQAIGAPNDLTEPESSALPRIPESSVRPLPSDEPQQSEQEEDPVVPEHQDDAVNEGITSLERAEQAINILTQENALLQRRLNNLNKQMAYLRQSFEKSNAALLNRIEELQANNGQQTLTTAPIAEVALQENVTNVPAIPEGQFDEDQVATMPSASTVPEPSIPNPADDITLETSPGDLGTHSNIPSLGDFPEAQQQQEPADSDVNLPAPSSSNEVDHEETLETAELQLFDMSSLINADATAQTATEAQSAGQDGLSGTKEEGVDELVNGTNFVLYLGIGLAAVGLLLLVFGLRSGSKKAKVIAEELQPKEPSSLEDDGFETTTFEPQDFETESFDDFDAEKTDSNITESAFADEEVEEMYEEEDKSEIDSAETVVETALETETTEAIPEIEAEAAIEAEIEADESDESFLISDEEFDAEDLAVKPEQQKQQEPVVQQTVQQETAYDELAQQESVLERAEIEEPPIPPQYDFSEQVEDNASIKLDLARAYLEMQDYDAAEEVLQSVISEGSAAQQKEAQALMDKLNADRG